MKELRVLRIVVASPADVQAERDTLPAIVDELNRSVAADRDVRLELSRWETDCYPGFHPDGAQGLIDPILRADACDILIGIFWKRFGTPVKEAKSGTEHEFRLAYEAWEQSRRPQIMVYFNQKPYAPRSSEEADEWKRVLEFRDAFPKEGLWWSYKGKAQFTDLVRGHLVRFIRNQFPLPSRPEGEREETPHRSTDELTREYRAHLADRVSKVYIFGEAESRELEEVFVELDIDEYRRPSNQNDDQTDDELRRRHSILSREYEDTKAKGQEGSGYEDRRTIKPEDLLREGEQAVITGAPGCGKTTLLKYLTWKTLKENERLPVFLELKTITEEAFKEAQNNLAELLFDKAVASLMHLRHGDRERFKEYFFTRLRAGKVAIFLDGLEEVSGTDTFPTLCESVREFIHSAYRDNSIVISTRPYALKARFEGLKEMKIAHLSKRQAERFLDHYYGDNPVTKQLVQTIRQNSQLGELVRVPFLALTCVAQRLMRSARLASAEAEERQLMPCLKR